MTFFSSAKRLQEFARGDVQYGLLPATDFLKATKGSYLVLNPGSDYGKFFVPEEVDRLLDGSMWQPSLTLQLPPESSVTLSEFERAHLPIAWMAMLERYFRTNRRVKRAWIGLLAHAAEGIPAHTLVVIEARGDFSQLVGEMQPILNRVQAPAPPVDILRYERRGGVGRQLTDLTGPFYVRRFLGLF
jgi:hypothetical protein